MAWYHEDPLASKREEDDKPCACCAFVDCICFMKSRKNG